MVTLRNRMAARQWPNWLKGINGVPWLGVLAFAGLCVLLGHASVAVGELAQQRPVFWLGLPLLLVIGFMLILNPQALLFGLLLIRAGANPVFEEARFGAIGGLGGVVNLAVIVLSVLIVSRNPKRVPAAAYWVWLPFFLMLCVGLVHSPEPIPALRLLLGHVSTFSLFVVAFYLVEDEASFINVLKLIVMSSVPVALVTIAFIATGRTAGAVDALEGGGLRFGGPFPHANILAFYLVLVIAVCLYLWKGPESNSTGLSRMLLVAQILLLTCLLYFTKTRSAWLALVLLFVVYGVFLERRFLLYLLLGMVAAMFVPELRSRVMGMAEGNEVVQYAQLNSFAWRKLIWAEGLTWMQPWRYVTGYGSEAFAYYSPLFFSMAGGMRWGAHSVTVQLIFELGVAGVLAFWWIFVSGWRIFLSAAAGRRVWFVIFSFLLLTYPLLAMSDNLLGYLIFNWYYWLAFGAAAGWAWRVRSEGADGAAETVPMAGAA